MQDERLLNGFADVASSYIKRWLEGPYDRLVESSFGQTGARVGEPAIYGVEFALISLIAYADQMWPASSPLGRIARSIAHDAPSEITRRLIKQFREETQRATTSSDDAEQVTRILLELDDESLERLIAWLAELDQRERTLLRDRMASLDPSVLGRLLGLTAEEREIVLGFERRRRKSAPRPLRPVIDAVKETRARIQAQRMGSSRGKDERDG